MGPAGAGSLAQVINGAIANKSRFDEMNTFFEGVGEGYAAAFGRKRQAIALHSRKNLRHAPQQAPTLLIQERRWGS